MSSWLFQANPDRFDVDRYLATRPSEIFWRVSQHAEKMALGDQVFIWRAVGSGDAAQSGVIAECEIISGVEALPEDEGARPFWLQDAERASEPLPRVKLRLVSVAEKTHVIKRAWAKDDPILRDMTIFGTAVQTNFLLTVDQAVRLNALWKNMGRDWTYPQLVAAMWVFNQTHPGPAAPKLMETVAIQIGRTVGSLESKVMNFRALDPRDDRAGLPAVSAMDRSVWKQFFDASTTEVRMTRLDDEYVRLWEPKSADEWAFLPSADQLISHWRAQEPTAAQRAMLAANYWSDQFTIRPSELARRVGLSGPSEANLRYGAFAGAMASALGTAYPANADRVSLFAAIVGPQGDKRWHLHDQTVVAIEALGWHLDFVPSAPDEQFLDTILRREGDKTKRSVNIRSRSGTVRDLCLEAHKAICVVCDLDFGAKFGPQFAGLVDVHHLDPLAQADECRLTDPVKDCRPLCPNCHRMAHYGLPPKKCRSIDELKDILRSATRAT